MKVRANNTDPVNSDDNYAPPGVVKCEDGKCMKPECLTCNPKNVQEEDMAQDAVIGNADCDGQDPIDGNAKEQDMALGMGAVHVPAPIGNPEKKEKAFGGEGSGNWGHAGVPGEVGGSAGGGGSGSHEMNAETAGSVAHAIAKSDALESGLTEEAANKEGNIARDVAKSAYNKAISSGKSVAEAHKISQNLIKEGKYTEEFSQKEIHLAELNMEVFATGTWNGDKYTDDDLNNIVKSYNAIGERVKPYLKLGHNEEQKLAKDSGFFKDGKPSLGWVGSLRKVGGKLVATFKDVPQVVAELVTKGAYKRVSSEIYTNYKAGDIIYPFVLKAVALLGADTPAVTTLHDVAAMYTEDTENTFREVNFSKDFNEEVKEMTENTVDLEKQFAEKEEALKKEFADKSAKMDEILAMFEGVDDLKKAVVEFQEKEKAVSVKEKQYTDHLEKARKEEVSKFVSALVSGEQMLPAQAKLAESILLNLGSAESTELKFADAKMYGYKEKMTLAESIKKFMSSAPKIGLLKEYTSQKKLYTDKNLESEELVKQYMEEHKVDYGKAQLAVFTARPELFSLNLETTGEESEDQE